MTTSLGPISGMGTSSKSSPGSARRLTRACIVLLTTVRIVDRSGRAILFCLISLLDCGLKALAVAPSELAFAEIISDCDAKWPGRLSASLHQSRQRRALFLFFV